MAIKTDRKMQFGQVWHSRNVKQNEKQKDLIRNMSVTACKGDTLAARTGAVTSYTGDGNYNKWNIILTSYDDSEKQNMTARAWITHVTTYRL